MSDAVLIALVSSGSAALAVGLREGIEWLRNRGKDEAEAGLTVDQRWERYADAQDERVAKLEGRVTALETERKTLTERIAALVAEVEHYRRVARAMARHVLRLRDALAATGADVPAMPADVEDALTVIDLPS